MESFSFRNGTLFISSEGWANGRTASKHAPSAMSESTAALFLMAEDRVMPGNAPDSSGSRYHSGAGAQLLTVIVCRL